MTFISGAHFVINRALVWFGWLVVGRQILCLLLMLYYSIKTKVSKVFGLVTGGLFFFNAGLGPQRRARKRGRLTEAALAHHALWDKAD
jgi:hypothetical protein